MSKSAEELKERLPKVSQKKNLGKLTYRIQKTNAENTLELVLHFENFKRTGKFAFTKDINKDPPALRVVFPLHFNHDHVFQAWS